MKVTISRWNPVTGDIAETEDVGEVERILAANEAFPYWTFYSKPDDNGEIKAVFYHERTVNEVALVGKEEAATQPTAPISREFGDIEI